MHYALSPFRRGGKGDCYNPLVSPRNDHRARSDAPLRSDALARLFESVREGIYVGTIDANGSGHTVAANPYLKLMFGYEPDVDETTIHPFDPERFVDPDSRKPFIEELGRNGAVTDYLLRLRRKDESALWVEVTAHLDDAESDGTRRIDALLRDVSERRKLEDQGRDMYHQLLQAEKLASLGQTVSGVAHELNNPLATILTWSERLAGRQLDSITKRGIETILGESERAAKIVRNLLTFSRKRHTTRSMLDVNQVVRETLALRAYDQRVSNVTAVDGLSAGLPQVFADPHHIKQVLLNLIINAEQSMLTTNGRGTLILRSWHDPQRDVVVLEIKDDGPGVPEDVQSKIFDPFFTTKSVGKGTGLGLTVAHALVQDHGGKIRLESEPGHGASFFIDFPTGDGLLQPPTASPAPPVTPTVGAGAPVLVVDDEPALAEAVADALTDAGFRVDRASDGQEALERIQEHAYDLIVCDLKMPRVDGPTFYRTLVKTMPSLKHRVIFMTGDVAGTDAEPFLEESGCRWLAKPFRLGDLLSVAREIVG